jgi:hypothetical protein
MFTHIQELINSLLHDSCRVVPKITELNGQLGAMGLRGFGIEIYVELKSQESHPIYGVLLLVQNPGDLLYLWHRDTHLQHKHKTLELLGICLI